MGFGPLTLARLTLGPDGLPVDPDSGDIYHPRSGALAQARHVFLAGNDLPERWANRRRFVILELGFGLGNNFLATWQAWQSWQRQHEPGAQLCYLAIEHRPFSRADMLAAPRDPALRALGDELAAAWPTLTPNLHRLSFDHGSVELSLALGDVQDWLPELRAQVDAFYLDGFAPARQPRMWDLRICKALARLAAPLATLATWSAASGLRQHLTTAGFEVRLGPGQGGKRDITLARYAPRFTPRGASVAARVAASPEPVVIVGAGLAGCATAWALAQRGVHSVLLERGQQVATGASGNVAGMFHGVVHADDSVHARVHRAAALAARQAIDEACKTHGVQGACDGLLRLETVLDIAAMRAVIDRGAWPADYVQALDVAQASERAGVPVRSPAWFYPGGGWVDPAGLSRAFLARAGALSHCRLGVEVATLSPIDGGWRLLDAARTVLVDATQVVLANAGNALRLLGQPDWPLESVRGQVSVGPSIDGPLPRYPLAGRGYVVPLTGGGALFGATTQVGDTDPAVRAADHHDNLERLAHLLGRDPSDAAWQAQASGLAGRTGWRWRADDRLPLVGAVPVPGVSWPGQHPGSDPTPAAHAPRMDQVRRVPRWPGLFVCTALGSRGITWSALAGQVVASAVSGAPAPLEASLLDALDPARFVSRLARRAGRA